MHADRTGKNSKRDDGKSEGQKDRMRSKAFGEEGTNKTQPKPDPHAKPSDVSGGGKFIEPSPFIR